MNLKNNYWILLLSICLFSCDKQRVFDEYESLGGTWSKNDTLKFTLPKLDKQQYYNLFLNIRCNDDYPFNNIFVLVSMTQPDGVTKVDTLEYEMANPDGSLMGEGITDVKLSKLFYKEKFQFKQYGVYKVNIQQALRKSSEVNGVKELKGITEVGFRIETLN